jgi:hypothetical protein
MTDEPIPDRSDELTNAPKLGNDADPIATGAADPTGAEAPHPSDGAQDGGRPDGDPSALTESGSPARPGATEGGGSDRGGDAPRPSPDI